MISVKLQSLLFRKYNHFQRAENNISNHYLRYLTMSPSDIGAPFGFYVTDILS